MPVGGDGLMLFPRFARTIAYQLIGVEFGFEASRVDQ